MQNVVLSWEFLSFWQSSAGKGEHARLDALTARDPQGLPVLPGRTIKGLFREAAQQLAVWGQLDQDAIVSLFGNADDTESLTGTGNGQLVFDTAYVSRELAAAYDKQELTNVMIYRDLAQTAIDRETGSALDHSLRRIEVVVPLTLYSSVSLLAGSGPALEVSTLSKIAREVRYAGSLRKRGLGRVEVKVEAKP